MSASPGALFSGHRFRRALRAFVAGRVAQAAATMMVTLLAVRILDGTNYGEYMVIWGVLEICVPLTSLGLLPATQRFLPELAASGSVSSLRRFVRWVGWARTGLIVVASLAVASGWSALAGWIGADSVDPWVPWLAAGLVFCVLRMRFDAEMLEAILEQRYAQTVRALLPLGRAAGMLLLWALDAATLRSLLLCDFLISAVALLLAQRYLRVRLKGLQPLGDRSVGAKELWRFVWHLSGAQLLNAVASVGTLRLVVARTMGVEIAGALSFMQQLVVIGNRYLPSVLLANLIRPMLVDRHAAGDHASVATGLGVLWKLNIAMVWPLVLLMALSGGPIVAALSGGRVVDAGPAMAFLMLALGALAQSQIVGLAYQVYGYTALARRVSLFALLVPLLAYVAARWGLVAVAAGYALVLWLRSFAGLIWLRRRAYGLATDWRGVLRVVAALAAAGLVAWPLMARWGTWAGAAGLLISYALACAVVRPLNGAEFELVARALKRRARWVRPFARVTG